MEHVNPFEYEREGSNPDQTYIVREYDGFDNSWIDLSDVLSREDALIFWNSKTQDGTKNIRFDDMVYYKIFPGNTRMLFRERCE